MYACVSVCAYMCVYVRACMCTRSLTHLCVFCVSASRCVHVCLYMCKLCACISVSMYTYSDTHACITVLEITVGHWLFSNFQHFADWSATVTVHF